MFFIAAEIRLVLRASSFQVLAYKSSARNDRRFLLGRLRRNHFI